MILIVAAALALASGVAPRVQIFVILLSLALGLQNGVFRRVGGGDFHTTYLTGMITSPISTETENYISEVSPTPVGTPDPKRGLLVRMWIAFVLGAGIGAAMVFHFKGFGILGTTVLLITLILCTAKGSPMVLTT